MWFVEIIARLPDVRRQTFALPLMASNVTRLEKSQAQYLFLLLALFWALKVRYIN